MPFRKPAPISDRHVLDGFDSGKPALDKWLMDVALHDQTQGYTRTFVIADEHYQAIDLQLIRERLGPDAPAMAADLLPKLVCRQCGARAINITYSPDTRTRVAR